MKQTLPTRLLAESPDLEQLEQQAEQLFKAFKANDAAAIDTVNAHHDSAPTVTFSLPHAQLVIARSYGLDSWPKLKAYVDGITIRQLVEAVQAGQFERVEMMLTARPELANMAVSYGDEHRAIHYAVMRRHPGIVQMLLQNGANARVGIYPHRDATSAWTLAHERGYDEIVALIEEEDDRRAECTPDPALEPAIETSDETARTAVANSDLPWLLAQRAEAKLINHIHWNDGGLLTLAVRHNHLQVLQFLLDSGFDPDERVSSGDGDWIAYSQSYPLWHAASLGRAEMATLLLARGANPNAHVDSSGSPVYSAYSHKQWEMVDLLRSRGGIVTADIAALYRQTDLARQMLIDQESGILQQSMSPSAQPLTEELLRFGADSGATGIVRMSLERIHWARNDTRWFRMLASPLSFWHHIPWLYAGNKDFDRQGYMECFRLLLNACDVNVVGQFGRTILHAIAAMGDWVTDDEVAAFGLAALQAGARLDQRDHLLSSTPLGWACRWGRIQLVILLIQHGANPDEPDAEAWARPRSWAQKLGHTEIVQALN